MNHMLVEESCSDMRRQARELLQGRWKNAFLITFIYYLVTGGVSDVFTFVFGNPEGFGIDMGLFGIYNLLVAGPLSYGYIVCLRRIAKGEQAAAGDLFSGFENFGKLFVLNLLLTIFILLWSLLFIIPGIIAAISYAMVYFIVTANDSLRPMEVIGLSKQHMRGNKGKFFLLNLSFMGWILLLCAGYVVLDVMVLGGSIADGVPSATSGFGGLGIETIFFLVGNVILMPYITMAHFVFYRHLTGEQDLAAISGESEQIE